MDENTKMAAIGHDKSKIMAKVKYDFSTSVIPLFRVILIGRSISYIIFMIQSHLQCKKSI